MPGFIMLVLLLLKGEPFIEAVESCRGRRRGEDCKEAPREERNRVGEQVVASWLLKMSTPRLQTAKLRPSISRWAYRVKASI